MQPGCAVSPVPTTAQEKSVREALISLIGEPRFERWFRQNTRLTVEGSELVVHAASPFLQKWFQKQHRGALAEAARIVLGPSASLRFEVDGALAEAVVCPAQAGPIVGGIAGAGAAPVDSPRADSPRADSPRADATSSRHSTHERHCAAAVGDKPPAPRTGRIFAELREFVVGPSNELALTAVQQVCERPDGSGGPLFVYGAVGTGKTHLLEGLYRELRRRHAGLQVVYLTAEQFTNHFTQAYRNHTLPAFRQRFRTVDVLLVDDVDFLDAKRVVQEEFLHTFQQLESQGRLVVACAGRHPRLIEKISDELRTRFLSGMVCRLELPDLDTRERIAVGKARRMNAEFTPEALRYVAQRFSAGVRELEGALNCLQVYYRMTGKRVGLTAARQVLGDLERDCLRVVRLADIERVVCDLFGVDAADLKSSRRTRSVTEPRMLAMYLARKHTRAAYSEIGEYFGGRNHATVISADRKVAGWLAADVSVKIASQTWRMSEVMETLQQQLQAG